MRKILLVLSLSLIFSNFFAQRNEELFYNETCYEISKVYKSDKNVEKYFKNLGSFRPKDYMYYYDIAIYFLDKKNYPKAYEYMVVAIQHGLSFEATRNFEINEFDVKHQKLIQENFLNDRNKTITYFYTQGTGDLMKFQFARDLLVADQTARYQSDVAGYKNPMVWAYISYTDSINMDTLVKFIKKFGMINYSNTGGDAMTNILYLHLKRYNNIYLDSCIKDNCYKRSIHPSNYSFAVDQQQEQGSTIYGTFDITKDTKFLDLQNIDKLRYAIGLASLYEQSLYQNFPLPKGYIIPKGLKEKYVGFLEEIKKEQN